MNVFLKKIFGFCAVVLLLCCGVFLPATPRVSQSLIFADRQKDELLRTTSSPRIIFIGGSNLSFGLNSQIVKDEIGLNPVNTGIHAKLGLKYILDNTRRFVREGDILVLVPEYEFFYWPYDNCSKELSRIIFDVDFSKVRLLSARQRSQLARRIPKYLISKIKPKEYWGIREDPVYSRSAFNTYGDAVAHWNMKSEPPSVSQIEGEYQPDIIRHIKAFEREIEQKGAVLYLSFPGLHQQTFDALSEKIQYIESELRKNELHVLGCAKDYAMPTEMIFDTVYHLNRNGVRMRTRQFIEDFKNENR